MPRHGEPPCTCDADGEHPQCPVHGYEIVIQRLRRENESLSVAYRVGVEALEEARDALGLLRGYVEMGGEGWDLINAAQRQVMAALPSPRTDLRTEEN